MKFPVYRFPEVVRALRNESGLTVLQAAELTDYGKYERWESGRTRVGPEYLDTLAATFGIEGDLWLLAYAWLVDRYTPRPGGKPVEFTRQVLMRLRGRLPKGEVDFGEHGVLAVRAISHGDLALMCLVARYGPSHAGAHVPLVLHPTKRTQAPPPDGSAYILDRYTDVLGDLMRWTGRTFLLGGTGQVRREVGVAVFRQTLLLLTDPEPFASLLATTPVRSGAKLRGLDGLSVGCSAAKFRRLVVRELEDLCRLAGAVDGRILTIEEMKAELRAFVHDDAFWDGLSDLESDKVAATLIGTIGDTRWSPSTEHWPVTRIVTELPEPDPALVAEMQKLRDQLDRRRRRAIAQEIADAAAMASPAAALDASVRLRRDQTRANGSGAVP